MNDATFDWLNSLFPNVKVFISVIVVLTGAGFSLYKIIAKLIDTHDEKVRKKSEEEENRKKFESQMIDFSDKVTIFIENSEKRNIEQDKHNKCVDITLERLSDSIEKAQEKSSKGDKLLEEQLRVSKETDDIISKKLEEMTSAINVVAESERDQFKSYLISEYYRLLDKKYIKYYEKENLEKRYAQYNSLSSGKDEDEYVTFLMDEIRHLPFKENFEKCHISNVTPKRRNTKVKNHQTSEEETSTSPEAS